MTRAARPPSSTALSMRARECVRAPLRPTSRPLKGAGSMRSGCCQASSMPRTRASPPLAYETALA